MENRSHALAAGAFVLVAVLLLLGLAWWLMDSKGERVPYDLLTKESVTGLQPQAAVRYRGVDVGNVTAISLDPVERGTVRVRVEVDPNTLVTRSTFGTLVTQGVTGLAFIQLDDDGGSKEPLRAEAGQVPRLPLRGGLLARLADQGAQMLDRLDSAIAKLDAILGPTNQAALTEAIGGIGDAARSVQQLATNTDRLMQTQLDPKKLNLPAMAQNANTSIDAMKSAANHVYGAADSVKTMVGGLQAQGGALDSFSESMSAITLGTLPRLNRLADNAGQSLRNLDSAVRGFNENPQALIYGGGVIAPGPGEPGFAQAARARGQPEPAPAPGPGERP